MSATDAYTDVVELCAMLQCLGFSVKSLNTSDTNYSQDGASRTVVINCQTSGLHVVLESEDVTCSCPSSADQQNSGIWQVSGVAGGKQLSKEYGSALLGSLPKVHRERLTKELQHMVRCIKENNESDIEKSKERENPANRSASMVELKTPEKRHFQIKSETPKRYRSLDTLTGEKQAADAIPAPGDLHKQHADNTSAADKKIQSMCQRQSTYTLSSTAGSIRRSNKTSSPIQAPPSTGILESLLAAEKTAEELRNKLSSVIREFIEEGRHDSSMSSLVLDVSKISVFKGGESSKLQFASSPNLSGLVTAQEDLSSKLKRIESASTSNLASTKSLSKDGKTSRLRKISPNIFKFKKDSTGMSKIDKLKSEDKKNSKLSENVHMQENKVNTTIHTKHQHVFRFKTEHHQGLLKPKTVTPARTSKSVTEANPNLSASRKKFSHIKSTIPRPASSSKKD